MTRAEKIAELKAKLAHYHDLAKHAETRMDRDIPAGIANETAREIVLLLAAIHSPKPKKGR